MVDLPRLDAAIIVYRNGGLPFVLEEGSDSSTPQDAPLLGKYELVGPVGAETPVYIPAL